MQPAISEKNNAQGLVLMTQENINKVIERLIHITLILLRGQLDS